MCCDICMYVYAAIYDYLLVATDRKTFTYMRP